MTDTHYDAAATEHRWQQIWEEQGAHRADIERARAKCYCLVMFPYPSGDRLHIGHWYNYGPVDSWARFRRMRGQTVLEPMGYDAFGLPAENYAIRHGVHPRESTRCNIDTMRRQIQAIGTMYDWSKELNTSSPDYYRWTQWLFLQLHRKGLAYRGAAPVNWCPSCKTVLANEQVDDGRCDRCESEVDKRNLTQWFFRITDYAERLLAGLDRIDWPRDTKTKQRNWIGRSEGAEAVFPIEGSDEGMTIFTTRPDTLFGVTYMVLAPEHPLVDRITMPEQRTCVSAYVERTRHVLDLDREAVGREKTGVFTGAYARNPLSDERIPIWIADYVLMSYGTGAIMAVPAHDERDHAFARTFDLPIREVIGRPLDAEGPGLADGQAWIGEGPMRNSGRFDGLSGPEARAAVTEELRRLGRGAHKVQYRLRDWLVSRQRYWGAPIPIVHCPACGAVPLPEEQLPVLLPDEVDFQAPRGDRSPLVTNPDWVRSTCPSCGGPGEREVDTMDTFVDSAWYFLRYPSVGRDDVPFDRETSDRWLPVDLYVGGPEHATKHLIYARFITQFLHDEGFISFDEPFQRLVHQGLITKDGAKMAKSKGNVVSPDDFVSRYGSDVFRMYMMFMGSFTDGGDWSDTGITGLDRFVQRVWRLALHTPFDPVAGADAKPPKELLRTLHHTIESVTADLETLSFNTAIARLMELLNAATRYLDTKEGPPPNGPFVDELLRTFNLLLAPLAPHLAEEIWARRGGRGSVFEAGWPTHDERHLARDEVQLAIQVDGKVRGHVTVAADADETSIREAALALPKVVEVLAGRPPRKVIVVTGRLVNIVV